MTKSPGIIILSDAALPMARRIARATGGEVHGLARRITESGRPLTTQANIWLSCSRRRAGRSSR
jgi:hypothetical protein